MARNRFLEANSTCVGFRRALEHPVLLAGHGDRRTRRERSFRRVAKKRDEFFLVARALSLGGPRLQREELSTLLASG
jgi:hypothetical protein